MKNKHWYLFSWAVPFLIAILLFALSWQAVPGKEIDENQAYAEAKKQFAEIKESGIGYFWPNAVLESAPIETKAFHGGKTAYIFLVKNGAESSSIVISAHLSKDMLMDYNRFGNPYDIIDANMEWITKEAGMYVEKGGIYYDGRKLYVGLISETGKELYFNIFDWKIYKDLPVGDTPIGAIVNKTNGFFDRIFGVKRSGYNS